MSTKSQIKTLRDKDNQVTRLSNKEKAFTFYKQYGGKYTIREAAKLMNVPYRVIQPRISELLKSSILIVDGTKEEKGQSNSILKLNPAPVLFGYGNKSNFQLLKEAVKKCCELHVREAIFDEFERMQP